MKPTYLTAFLMLLCSSLAWGSQKWGISLTTIDDSTFRVKNRLSTFTLKVEEGAVRLLNQSRQQEGVDVWNGKSVYFFKEDPISSYDSWSIEEEWVERNRVTNAHLRVNVSFQSENQPKKLVFRLYPESTMLACDAYYRGISGGLSVKSSSLFSMETDERHWRYKAVEFFDRTDENNNLVRELDIVGYQNSQYLNGNLLFANDLMHNGSFLILKEAPSSFSQIDHPGYDFDLTKYGLKVMGLGFKQSDLKTDQWTKSYSVAVSSSGPTEFDQLSTLRSYQKSIRPHRADWDEMIMMNNWGDRNKDSNYSEDFVRREIDACKRLGITHYQIDDGWQQGLSKNSSISTGNKWDQWELGDWEPHKDRFPNGFEPVVAYAKEQGVTLGLWFAPSNANSFSDWERDARVIINLNKKFGIRYFKIDGIRLPDKLAEENLRSMYELILKETDYNVFFNVDATAHDRGGYHFLYEYGGNIFLENRYTTFAKYYYPYQTLRNLWMLSKYAPAERFQIEFLNKWKNQHNYSKEDIFSPINIPFDYTFAITMMAQPLAWFEGTGLPEEAFSVGDLIKRYSEVSQDIHQGTIFPIGDEPCGRCWTGFQSISSYDEGFLMIYRELNDSPNYQINTYLEKNQTYEFTTVLGRGRVVTNRVSNTGHIEVSIPDPHGFLLIRYELAY